MHAVEISYLQSNQPPQLDELAVLEPGQILVPSNFNPQNQVFEPAYPNREGIFTTLAETKDNRGLKPLWKRGFRTLRWTARDPNEDELTFAVDVRREDDADGWLRDGGRARGRALQLRRHRAPRRPLPLPGHRVGRARQRRRTRERPRPAPARRW